MADTDYNVAEIINAAKEAESNGANFIVFPELAITGYTCNDLFHQETLLKKTEDAIVKIAEYTLNAGHYPTDNVVVVGAPVRIYGRLYNCAVFIQGGKIVAVTPKIHLPNQREFYEKRHFSRFPEEHEGMFKHDIQSPHACVGSIFCPLFCQVDKKSYLCARKIV